MSCDTRQRSKLDFTLCKILYFHGTLQSMFDISVRRMKNANLYDAVRTKANR